jgi:beta-ketoacyl-acyl-carrier-protein synthase II
MVNRVVITGMGTVNPLGLAVEESWENAIKGTSGVGPITLIDASDLLVQIACEVKGFEPDRYQEARQARRQDRFEQMAIAAANEAVDHAGLDMEKEDPGRVAVIVSTAVGGMRSIEDGIITLHEKGARRVSPFLIPMFMPNGAGGMIAIKLGATGPNFSVASACASGADGIGQSWMLIRSGAVDVALAGATESTITRIGVGAFDRLGALSRRNDDYSMTPAPFDLNRDGLVMGEGAALLVLESLEHAKARGATILAELAGYASTSDAFHVTAPSTEGIGGAAAIARAAKEAGLNTDEIDYINAHGTATQLNDPAETKAIKAALGKSAYDVPVSSTKSMTGHMMGATGALEAIFCVKAIETNTAPPTIHYQEPDPECDLDYVPNEARQVSIDTAMSNAFGFGGHNAVLAFRSFSS